MSSCDEPRLARRSKGGGGPLRHRQPPPKTGGWHPRQPGLRTGETKYASENDDEDLLNHRTDLRNLDPEEGHFARRLLGFLVWPLSRFRPSFRSGGGPPPGHSVWKGRHPGGARTRGGSAYSLDSDAHDLSRWRPCLLPTRRSSAGSSRRPYFAGPRAKYGRGSEESRGLSPPVTPEGIYDCRGASNSFKEYRNVPTYSVQHVWKTNLCRLRPPRGTSSR